MSFRYSAKHGVMWLVATGRNDQMRRINHLLIGRKAATSIRIVKQRAIIKIY